METDLRTSSILNAIVSLLISLRPSTALDFF